MFGGLDGTSCRGRLGPGKAPCWATTARARGSQQSHHPAGPWTRSGAGSGHGARAKPAAPRCFSPHEGERGRLWEQERPHSTSLPGHSTGPGTAGSIGNSQRSTPGVSHLLPREDTPQPPPSTTSLSLRGPRETIPCGKTAGDSRDWLRASGFSSSFPRQSQLPSLVCFTAAMSCALLTRHTLLENLFHIFRGINLQLLKLLDTVVVA